MEMKKGGNKLDKKNEKCKGRELRDDFKNKMPLRDEGLILKTHRLLSELRGLSRQMRGELDDEVDFELYSKITCTYFEMIDFEDLQEDKDRWIRLGRREKEYLEWAGYVSECIYFQTSFNASARTARMMEKMHGDMIMQGGKLTLRYRGLDFSIGRPDGKDIVDIIRLQNENLRVNMDEEKRRECGYVGLRTSEQLVKQLLSEKLVVVARTGSEIVGYQMTGTAKSLVEDPLARQALSVFESDELSYDGKPLRDYDYCVLMQLLIEPKWRGKMMGQMIFVEQIGNMMQHGYELVVTAIDKDNPVTNRFHIDKLGMEILGSFQRDSEEWLILIKDLRCGGAKIWMDDITSNIDPIEYV